MSSGKLERYHSMGRNVLEVLPIAVLIIASCFAVHTHYPVYVLSSISFSFIAST